MLREFGVTPGSPAQESVPDAAMMVRYAAEYISFIILRCKSMSGLSCTMHSASTHKYGMESRPHTSNVSRIVLGSPLFVSARAPSVKSSCIFDRVSLACGNEGAPPKAIEESIFLF